MRRTLFESLVQVTLTEPPPQADEGALAELAASVERAARRRLGRSLSIREVDAGSCNGCELEIMRSTMRFTIWSASGCASWRRPACRCADGDGPVTKNMREALQRTYDATPDPKWVVAVGDCAVDGGIFSGSTRGGRRAGGGAGRSAYPRLPAQPDTAAQGPAGVAGAHCVRVGRT